MSNAKYSIGQTINYKSDLHNNTTSQGEILNVSETAESVLYEVSETAGPFPRNAGSRIIYVLESDVIS